MAHALPIIDGRPATAEQLAYPALVNYGHYTSLQVRDGRTRGLDLHLLRLSAATVELFGVELDGDRVRHSIRVAMDTARDASVRVTVFAPPDHEEPCVLVAVREPEEPATTPATLRSVEYRRSLAHLKHVGAFGRIHHRRQVERLGFTDALFIDHHGEVSETSIANIGFHDGRTVIWPQAPALAGTTMQLLGARLPGFGTASRQQPVRLSDIAGLRSAFLTNSIGIRPVIRIDDHSIPIDIELMTLLTEAYASVPWDRI